MSRRDIRTVIQVESETCPDTGAVLNQVHAIKARSRKDASRVAIHLLSPSQRELESAFGDAFAKGFDLIVVHSPKTWPYRTGGAA